AAEGALGNELGAHERHFTVGLNLGGAGCEVPDADCEWVPLPPPVLLDEWAPPSPRRFDRFTSVATWRNPLGTIEYGGRAYTLKHHQLRRFAGLPAQTGLPFEIALDIHPDEAEEAARLLELGWTVVDPAAIASDPDSFREYARGSGAEFSVAQGIYAEAGSGWISDRTAHYLAAGRPALVQETGLPASFRPDAGLVTFSEPEEAQAQAEGLLSAYELHSTAARAYAERTFDSDLVLTRMLEGLE
ncbi:MAG TPA: glycosyltransferase, partial [Solirubrobacterales bacterium]|nr:glycosyltransferase [Solirubrobacterales bacterium]